MNLKCKKLRKRKKNNKDQMIYTSLQFWIKNNNKHKININD